MSLNLYIGFISPSFGSYFIVQAVISSRPGPFFLLTLRFHLLFVLK